MENKTVSWISSMMLMGTIVEDFSVWPQLLLGELDTALLPGIFYHGNGRPAFSDEEMMADEKSAQALENLKRFIRNRINGIISQETARLERQQRKEVAQMQELAKQRFVGMSKPAPEGTVREIAERHGVSIGVVRKLKAENRLHELLVSGQ